METKKKQSKVGRKKHEIKKVWIWVLVEPKTKILLEEKYGKKILKEKIINFLKTL